MSDSGNTHPSEQGNKKVPDGVKIALIGIIPLILVAVLQYGTSWFPIQVGTSSQRSTACRIAKIDGVFRASPEDEVIFYT